MNKEPLITVTDETLENFWQPQWERPIKPSDYKNQEEYGKAVREWRDEQTRV